MHSPLFKSSMGNFNNLKPFENKIYEYANIKSSYLLDNFQI